MARQRSWTAALAFLALVQVSAMSPAQPDAGREMLEAAARGDAARLKQLIAAGAPLDPMDGSKQTPLLLTVQNNHLAAAAALIEAGANINAQAANLDSPGCWPARAVAPRCCAT